METRPMDGLTVWEAKERAGLLAIETDEWRQKRLIAEDPSATGDVLNGLADRFNQYRSMYEAHFDKGDLSKMLLLDAVAAHPNAPADLLLFLARCSFSYDAFSHFDYPMTYPFAHTVARNPVAPFLVLEVPDFWEQAEIGIGGQSQSEACRTLLREPHLPPALVHVLTRHTRAVVAQSARLHIALAGEIQTELERDAFRREVKTLLQDEVRLAEKNEDNHSYNNAPKKIYLSGQSFRWRHRLLAALMLPLTTEPFEEDSWNRTPLDLLHHLAHDGNRLVRWVSKAHLANPNFTFTWHEGNV